MKHVDFDGGEALSSIGYTSLVAALTCTSAYLESLTLPTELWMLPSAITRPPATFCHFERLQYLCVPRQALLGTKAFPLPSSCADWHRYYKTLHEGGQWINESRLAHEGLHNRQANPNPILQDLVEVLPKSLRHLKVVDADGRACAWLNIWLGTRPRQSFPQLERL
jgi:hypothetical protein